jgi:hypothetical protein
MTTLASQPLDPDQLDMLELIADNQTPLGTLHRDDFKAACLEDASRHEGWVNPNRVSAILHARFGEINPRALSAQWAGACGRNGFLDKTDLLVPIDPKHSRGNGGKSLAMRRVRAA